MWHDISDFKEANVIFKEKDMLKEARRLSEKSFLKALLKRLKVRNLKLPDEQLTFPQEVFKSMVKDVIKYTIKIHDEKLVNHLEPVLTKLKEKGAADEMDHVSHEIIKLMTQRGFTSGPGDVVAVYRDC